MLGGRDICISKVNTIEEALSDPQLINRGLFTEIEVPSMGKVKQVSASCPKLSETMAKRGRPPIRGEHTEETLMRLGYSDIEINSLSQEEVI